jgi:hypothetical protein
MGAYALVHLVSRGAFSCKCLELVLVGWYAAAQRTFPNSATYYFLSQVTQASKITLLNILASGEVNAATRAAATSLFSWWTRATRRRSTRLATSCTGCWSNPELSKVPLLVLGNKVDTEPHMSHDNVIQALNLDYITENKWTIVEWLTAISKLGR